MIKSKLSRELGVALLLFYGLGNILGAGIYVLVGKVAGVAGYSSVLSFVVACIIAIFTALSYMELASRYPVSSGEAVYIKEGIGSKNLAIASGIFIALAGLISAAALSHGFVGYLSEFISIPVPFAITMIILLLVLLSIKGIKASIITASIFTAIEIFGLLLIIYFGFDNIINPNIPYTQFIPEFDIAEVGIIFLGSFLAFYAFIGFEDMVNVAEEVKNPTQTFPRAILLALIISTILYILIILVALQSLELEQLVSSKAPLSDIYQNISGYNPMIISIIGLFAVINGALIQIIMASRVVYGLSSRGWLPKYFSRVSNVTKTPVEATVLVGIVTVVFALFFDLVTLAGFTSMLILIIFTLVNIALIRIKKIKPKVEGVIEIPVWIPWCGVILNLLLISVKVF